jgi:uncharacterized delta-60 repeat protein
MPSKLSSGAQVPTGVKKILIAILALVGLALPAHALAEPGELDESFGRGGWVTTPMAFHRPWSGTEVELAAAPDGGSFVAADGRLARYLEDGQLDPGFGGDGIVSIVPGRGFHFVVGDLGVDPQGRAVAIGTALRGGHSRAAVLRYLPDGTLDPGFAGDGVLLTDLGIGARATTAALGAVDDQGRILVLGGVVRRGSRCGRPPSRQRQDLVLARLTPDGSFDLSFGGLHGSDVEPLRTVTAMAVAPGGAAVLAGETPHRCGAGPRTGVIRLRADGSRVGRFGVGGTSRFTGSAVSIALDPHGRIVVLCRARQLQARDEHATKVLRLLPDGRLDPELEGGWIVYTTEGPFYRWSTVAVRANGNPILAGTLVRPPSEKDARFHRWFLAVPLRQNGRLEDNVSWRGWAWITRLDKRADAAASEALVDARGRLLLAGTLRRPGLAPEGALALARFELD